MKERPILFSAPMVQAILDGRKTQTRRAIKGVPSWDHYGRDIMDWGLSGIHQFEDDLHGTDRWALDVQTEVDNYSRKIIRCPYGKPGDRLWVRETWGAGNRPCPTQGWVDGIEYRADCVNGDPPPLYEIIPADVDADSIRPGWRPSIHMPRWASRILLEITDVRVERLNDISEADCIAEGWPGPDMSVSTDPEVHRDAARDWYSDLWGDINGPQAWAENPWVWVVAFNRVDAA